MLFKILICFLAGAGAGIGTGFAGMSAAAVIGPLLTTFLNIEPYQAIGIGLASDVLASAGSAYTYYKNGNLDIKNSIPLLISVLLMTVCGSYVASFLPASAMSGSMQFMMIILGLRFILKPVTPSKENAPSLSSKERIKKVEDVLKVGDKVTVKVLDIDDQGRINLTAILSDDKEDKKEVEE